MKTILFVYPPFAPVTIPPYSIVNLIAFLRNNLPDDFQCHAFDANVFLQRNRDPDFFRFMHDSKQWDPSRYQQMVQHYEQTLGGYIDCQTRTDSSTIPHDWTELIISEIVRQDPTYVAFSVLFSSQEQALLPVIRTLREKGYPVVCGGPGITDRIKDNSDAILQNELDLLSYIQGKEIDHDSVNFEKVLDYSVFPLSDYATPESVIPFRTTTACYYKKCTYCVHPSHNAWYYEFPLEMIEESFRRSGIKYVFFTDDLIHVKRLRELGRLCSRLGIKWMCQLRPTTELTKEILNELSDNGLVCVWWGVESANQKILDSMQKGTSVDEIRTVLSDSSACGVRNGVFVMFGFPGETRQQAEETVRFLQENADAIDLVSASVFELYALSAVMKSPEQYGVTNIHLKADGLGFTYDVTSGMTQTEAYQFREEQKDIFQKIANVPLEVNRFREHLLFF